MKMNVAALLLAAGLTTVRAADVRVEMTAESGGKPLPFDALGLTNEHGQRYSVTRLDFHLSGIALKRADGSWAGPEEWTAYLSMREGRSGFTLRGVPADKYSALRFHVGLPPKLNAADATKFPAGHPLNPSVTSLWWGWQGGYVFFAIEGAWRAPDGGLSGYSWHVATDRQLMTVELPCELDTSQPRGVQIALDTDAIVKGVRLSDEAASTHSRGEDALAAALKGSIEKAFRITSVSAPPAEAAAARQAAGPRPGERLMDFSFPSIFPMPSLPGDNPLTRETVELGRSLFQDKRLSRDGTVACASCHDPARQFSDARQFSEGIGGQKTLRHSMPLLNLAWKTSYFWDGRAKTLREQALEPIQNPLEMGETLEGVEKKTGLTRDRIAGALEQYLLTLISAGTRFDRVLRGDGRFTEAEQRGFDLFHTEYDPRHGQRGADCFHCHSGPLFQSVPFANNGLDATFKDEGRARVTGRAGDKGKFATPSLRNVALTAPYMHDGRFATLEQVIDHYDHGLQRSDTLDPNLAKHPAAGLGLSAEDKAALVAFLKTLSEEKPK